MSGHTLAGAGKAQSLLGGRLDRNLLDRAADGGGKVLAHLQNVRRELGRLREYGCEKSILTFLTTYRFFTSN